MALVVLITTYTHSWFYSLYRNATIIFILSSLITMVLSEVLIEEIKPKGLILEKLGDAYIHDKVIKLLIKTPHEEYIKQQNFIINTIHTLNDLRNVSYDKNSFDNIIYELKLISNTISEINEMIINNSASRSKRETVDDAWYVIIWDFIFDCICSTNVDEAVTMIATLLNNQSQEMIKTVIAIQAKNNDTDTRIYNIVNKLDELVEEINLYGKTIEHEIRISNLIQLLTFAIIRYKSFQNKVVTYILEGVPIHLDPEIFPISVFKSILSEVMKNTNETEMWPWNFANEKSFINWYQIIQMTVAVEKDHISIEINIPLLSPNKREIYEAIPAPFSFDNALYIL